MERPLMTFRCFYTGQLGVENGRTVTIRAHFVTREDIKSEYRFWIKPRWYSRRRMVGVLTGSQWSITSGDSDAEIMQSLGVRI